MLKKQIDVFSKFQLRLRVKKKGGNFPPPMTWAVDPYH